MLEARNPGVRRMRPESVDWNEILREHRKCSAETGENRRIALGDVQSGNAPPGKISRNQHGNFSSMIMMRQGFKPARARAMLAE